MKRKKIRLLAVLLVVVVVGGVLWGMFGSSSAARDGAILTSGFIEARDVSVAFEVSGRIVEIAVEEGYKVEAGVLLVKLDDSLLKAQQKQARAAITVALVGLEQAIASI